MAAKWRTLVPPAPNWRRCTSHRHTPAYFGHNKPGCISRSGLLFGILEDYLHHYIIFMESNKSLGPSANSHSPRPWPVHRWRGLPKPLCTPSQIYAWWVYIHLGVCMCVCMCTNWRVVCTKEDYIYQRTPREEKRTLRSENFKRLPLNSLTWDLFGILRQLQI